MKKLILYISILFIITLLVSCKDVNSVKTYEKAKVFVSFTTENQANSSARAASFVPEQLSDKLNFKLYGTFEDAEEPSEELLVTFENRAALSTCSAEIYLGNWSFRFTAYLNETAVLEGSLTKVIKKEGNNLKFEMTSKHSAGDFDAKFSFAKDRIGTAKVTLTSFDTDEEIYSGFVDITEDSEDTEKSYVSYSKDEIPEGTYSLFVQLFDNTPEKHLVATKSVILLVKSGCNTVSECTIDNIQVLYKITFIIENIGWSFYNSEFMPVYYTAGNTIVLPDKNDIKIDDTTKEFYYWYSSSDLSEESKVTQISSTDTGDKTFYGKVRDKIE